MAVIFIEIRGLAYCGGRDFFPHRNAPKESLDWHRSLNREPMNETRLRDPVSTGFAVGRSCGVHQFGNERLIDTGRPKEDIDKLAP